jgi:phage gpG-like protein
MKNFRNLRAFEQHLRKVVQQEPKHKKAILEVAAQYIEDDAKRKFGVYQEAAGPFSAWAPLADSTKQDRTRKGFEPDNPLYRTGELMNSIYHVVEGNTAVIGSDEDIMVYQELGTVTIPARSTLGAAAFESKKKIEAIVVEGVMAWLMDKPVIKKKL